MLVTHFRPHAVVVGGAKLKKILQIGCESVSGLLHGRTRRFHFGWQPTTCTGRSDRKRAVAADLVRYLLTGRIAVPGYPAACRGLRMAFRPAI